LNGSNPRPGYLAIAQLRAMQMTMTSNCFIGWAWVVAQKESFDYAHRFGRLVIQLAKEGKGGYHDARSILMYYVEIYHWRNPYHDGLVPTSKALQELNMSLTTR